MPSVSLLDAHTDAYPRDLETPLAATELETMLVENINALGPDQESMPAPRLSLHRSLCDKLVSRFTNGLRSWRFGQSPEGEEGLRPAVLGF